MENKNPDISIVMPAYNEEGNIVSAVESMKIALETRFQDYEIIILNDASTDATGKKANGLAAADSRVTVIHHEKNMGVGYTIFHGYRKARGSYVMWYPGDDGMARESLISMFQHAGEADMVIPYIDNSAFRSTFRRILSRLYVLMFNTLFGLKIRYYNGPVIFRTHMVNSFTPTTHGFAVFAETLIVLLKKGGTYLELPTLHKQRMCGISTACSFKTVREIFQTVLALVGRFYLNRVPAAMPHAARD